MSSLNGTVSRILTNHTAKHLQALGYGDNDEVCLRGFSKARGGAQNWTTTPAQLIQGDTLQQWQDAQYGIYVVVNPGGHKDADINQGRVLFYEHDELSKDISRDLWQHLGLPAPTCQVDTGGKSIHSYWRLTAPIPIEQWKALQADLLEFSDGDRKIKNPSRVMRLAGCIHPATGQHSKIVGGTGEPVAYQAIRDAIPTFTAPTAPSQEKSTGLTWTEFDRGFSLPAPYSIPLDVCLSRDSRDLLVSGATDYRNDSGAKLARDLIGTAKHLRSIGQGFDGDPEGLFESYCRRCPQDDWAPKEWASIWKSAEAGNPGPSLSPDKIEGCAKTWIWKTYHQNRTQSLNPDTASPRDPAADREDFPQADDDKKAGEIEALVRSYLGEPNAAKRALLKTRLLRDYGLPRPELKDLEQAYAPLPEIKLRHISGPSTDYEISLLDVIEKKATGEIEAGIPTGFTDLDRRLRGVRRKKLYLIAGRPSDGKSALAENIALNVAKATQRAGKTDPVVIFSPEMTHDEWKERALAIESGIDSGRIAAGMIADHEWGPLAQHYATVDSLPVFIDDSTGITVEYMQRSCEWMQENHGLPSMVIVDYLSLVSADGTSSNNRVQEISHIARQLQKMAKALNVPLFVLSQLSRALMGRNDKRPVLSDLRESGELEQVADVVMMLYRDEEHNPDTLDKGITEVILRKNRQGSKGTVKLLFEAEFTRFRDIA